MKCHPPSQRTASAGWLLLSREQLRKDFALVEDCFGGQTCLSLLKSSTNLEPAGKIWNYRSFFLKVAGFVVIEKLPFSG